MTERSTGANERSRVEFEIEGVQDLETVWPEITSLFQEFEAYHQAFQSRELVADWQERLKERLRLHEDRLVLLGRTEYEPAGCLVGVIRRSEGLALETYAYLSYAFVREPYRSMGLGRELTSRAEAWCRERGATRIELDVFRDNAMGLGFWSSLGFQPLSLTMTKSLRRAS